MPDFTAHSHPVLAIPCPDCPAKAGAWCVRPSGHRAADFYAARKAESDRVFIEQHGEWASIDRTPAGQWAIYPNGRAGAAAQADLFEENA